MTDQLRQAAQQAEPCVGKDPRCPCQDGDACHYKDCGNTKAWPVPQAEPTPWRDMVVVTLVREGINKHRARELADHFAAQPEQEPVAWEHHEYRPYGAPGEIRIHAILASQYMLPDGSVAGDFQWLVDQYRADKNTIKLIPLYTPPAAQRPWVGLTDEDVNKESAMIASQMKLAFHAGMYVAQQILKERNT